MTDRQKELLNAALEIVSREGFSRLTIRNVATLVGMTEPGLYRHFESKLALLISMLEFLESQMLPYFNRFAEHEGSLEEGFQVLIQSLFRELEERPAFAAFLFSDEVFHNEPGIRPALSAMLRRNQALVIQALSSLQTRSLIRQDILPENLALLVMGSIRLTVSHWHLEQKHLALLDRQESLIQTLVTVLKTA